MPWAAHAGPSLHEASARDEVLERGAWSTVAPPAPAPAPVAGLTIALGGPRPDTPPLVAEDLPGRGGVRWQSGSYARGAWRWRAGLAWRHAREPDVTLEGSELVRQLGDSSGESELYASVQRRHWGPGWVGSLILDGAAPAVPAVGWRRPLVQPSAHPWLGWIGPWGADVFFGRLQGHSEPARPYLIGMRAQLSPSDRLDIGLTRTMQWGGRGRDESSSSLVNSLLGNDNVGFDGINAENEPGNQLAGVDVRWVADPVSQTAFYLQIVGEDEAGHLPSRNMLLVGTDTRVPTARGQMRFFAEFADLLSGRISDDPRPLAAYRHSVYRQGYTQEGFSLGHAVGGDSRLASAGWLYRTDTWQALFIASAGDAEPTAQFFSRGRILGLNASFEGRLDALTHLGVSAAWWADRVRSRQTLQVWIRSAVF